MSPLDACAKDMGNTIKHTNYANTGTQFTIQDASNFKCSTFKKCPTFWHHSPHLYSSHLLPTYQLTTSLTSTDDCRKTGGKRLKISSELRELFHALQHLRFGIQSSTFPICKPPSTRFVCFLVLQKKLSCPPARLLLLPFFIVIAVCLPSCLYQFRYRVIDRALGNAPENGRSSFIVHCPVICRESVREIDHCPGSNGINGINWSMTNVDTWKSKS